ncbi:GntR family transcriptional regulator [Mycolicibacterium iranicum]|uniref:GntR family transcriptional regulator n=1 Tax=Mycolicibacterium iranicum TaxID=912594 RepID=A0A1X1WRD6_MYCIR|nr:GntR family transcriptional regulator [Mycolicibacterium iranicum]MCZ0731307.1 GntR family transcriptional regulator [Mycolicibacterium iranicum]ORV89205.1 GntR family transcriptional regulator [Mycolicibacterium iranicum]
MPSGTPLYMTIAADLRGRIETEQMGPHTLLPSERELAEQHKVSRMTARQALSLLESEGVVYRKPPRGTFVAEPRVRFHIGSFSEEVARMGRRPAAQLLWAEHQIANPAVRRALDLEDGAAVHVFHRLRSVDDVPFALETTFLPAALTPGILDMTDDGSLWAVLRSRYGIELARSTAVLESIVLDDASSMQLGVRAGSAGTLLTRNTVDNTGRCVEYARDVYRADRAAFEVSEVLPSPRLSGV